MLYTKATFRVEKKQTSKQTQNMVRLTDQHLQKSVPLIKAVKFVN